MRTVFRSHSEVCHVFANLEGEERFSRRGRAGNVYFENGTLYSYGGHFTIARWVDETSDNVLFTTLGYSPSTGKHLRIAVSALSHRRLVHVPYPTFSANDNFDTWQSQLSELFGKLSRARKPELYTSQIAGIRDRATRYAETVNATIPPWFSEMVNSVNFEEYAAKAAERVELERIEAERIHSERLTKWRAGELHYLGGISNGFSYLRLNGRDRIETSQGVEMGLRYARELFGRIKHAVTCEAGASCDKGELVGELVLDRYRISEVSKSRIKIGCHTIPMSEIDAIANALSWNESSNAKNTLTLQTAFANI